MGNAFDSFEESLRSGMEDFSYHYDASAWAEMESRLNQAGSGVRAKRYSSLLVAAGFAVLSSACFVLFPRTGTDAHSGIAATPVYHNWHDAFAPFHGSETEQPATSYAELVDPALASRDASAPMAAQLDQPLTAVESPTAHSEAAETAGSSGNEAYDPVVADLRNTNEPPVKAIAEEAGDDEAAASIQFTASEVCAGEAVTFSVDMNLEGLRYLWIFEDGDFSKEQTPTHTFSDPGVWNVGLSVQDDRGKIIASSIDASIIVHPKPEADFSWQFVNAPGEVAKVQFRNESRSASECEWQFVDGSDSEDINPTREFFQRGKHPFKLVATNEFGCEDEQHSYLYVDKEYNLEAPVAMSRGEMAFVPEALYSEKRDWKLTLYHGGQPTYETTSVERPWDGTLANGSLVEAGTSCPWVLIIYGRSGLEKEYFSGELIVTP